MAENYARLRQAQGTVQRAARLLVTLVVGDILVALAAQGLLNERGRPFNPMSVAVILAH
jgi:hypothetical protein